MFTRATFKFLDELAANNNRSWFEAHKREYEGCVRTPALEFIGRMSDEMPSISRHFLAQPKKAGGSLLRVQRDTRFSRDKTPYKTNIGIQFRHELGKDVHAPGYYLHIAPEECFLGIGLWRPDADALFKIRQAIVQNDEGWLAARDDKDFRSRFTLEGDALANAPRGFARDHPRVEDLKRKDFIAMASLGRTVVTSKNLLPHVVRHYRQAAPYMRFLCEALGLRF